MVTGASSGIGFELARVFAAEGFDLLIAAEDAELAAAQEELTGLGVQRRSAPGRPRDRSRGGRASTATSPTPAVQSTRWRSTPGSAPDGAFATETDLGDELRLIDLNVRSTVHLCKLVVADMVGRDEGRILFTSSIAATMPGAFQAVYNASKSFVQSFALALRNELKDTGITITSLMPGPTETEFFERAEMEDTAVGAGEKDDPAEVARQGFDALMAGNERVVAGAFKNKAQVAAGRVLPDSIKAEKHREMAEPGSAKED